MKVKMMKWYMKKAAKTKTNKKKRKYTKRKTQKDNIEEIKEEVQVEQNTEGVCNAQECHQKEDIEDLKNRLEENEEIISGLERENEHLYERLKLNEQQIKYNINADKREKSAQKPSGKIEANPIEENEKEEGAQKTTNELIKKEVGMNKEIKRVSIERQSMITARFSQITTNNEIVSNKKYIHVDVEFKGVEYTGCLCLYGLNSDGVLVVIVPKVTINGATNVGLKEEDINGFREMVREKGKVVAVANGMPINPNINN